MRLFRRRRVGSAERERSAESRAQAESEVIAPLRELRREIDSTPRARDTDPDIFAQAIRDAIRGEM